jgi:hypothetical protein
LTLGYFFFKIGTKLLKVEFENTENITLGETFKICLLIIFRSKDNRKLLIGFKNEKELNGLRKNTKKEIRPLNVKNSNLSELKI